VVSIDQCAPVRFLQAAFDPDDSIGVLLKTYRTGQVIQRIVPVASARRDQMVSAGASTRERNPFHTTSGHMRLHDTSAGGPVRGWSCRYVRTGWTFLLLGVNERSSGFR